jgi:hypothetical protein
MERSSAGKKFFSLEIFPTFPDIHDKGEFTMPRQTRYSRWLTIAGLFALILVLASCQSGCGTTIQKPFLPTAPQLINRAQDAIQQVTSYHFNLATTHPGTSTGNSIQINKADGDLQVPDKLQAKANIIVFGFAVTTQYIAIANQQYYTDPLTGLWTQTNQLMDPRTLTNRSTGIAGILGNIQHPSTPTNSSVGGVPCWNINGKLDARYLSVITQHMAQVGNIINTTICIGKADNLPYVFRMQGIAIPSDTAQTVRTFLLSRFNEPLRITIPQVA